MRTLHDIIRQQKRVTRILEGRGFSFTGEGRETLADFIDRERTNNAAIDRMKHYFASRSRG